MKSTASDIQRESEIKEAAELMVLADILELDHGESDLKLVVSGVVESVKVRDRYFTVNEAFAAFVKEVKSSKLIGKIEDFMKDKKVLDESKEMKAEIKATFKDLKEETVETRILALVYSMAAKKRKLINESGRTMESILDAVKENEEIFLEMMEKMLKPLHEEGLSNSRKVLLAKVFSCPIFDSCFQTSKGEGLINQVEEKLYKDKDKILLAKAIARFEALGSPEKSRISSSTPMRQLHEGRKKYLELYDSLTAFLAKQPSIQSKLRAVTIKEFEDYMHEYQYVQCRLKAPAELKEQIKILEDLVGSSNVEAVTKASAVTVESYLNSMKLMRISAGPAPDLDFELKLDKNHLQIMRKIRDLPLDVANKRCLKLKEYMNKYHEEYVRLKSLEEMQQKSKGVIQKFEIEAPALFFKHKPVDFKWSNTLPNPTIPKVVNRKTMFHEKVIVSGNSHSTAVEDLKKNTPNQGGH